MHHLDDGRATPGIHYMPNDQFPSASSTLPEVNRWTLSQHLLQQQQAQHTIQPPNAIVPGCMDPRGLDRPLHYIRQQNTASRSASPMCSDARASPSPWSVVGKAEEDQLTDPPNPAMKSEEEFETKIPYNQLLYQCFMSMPQKECLLKDIYDWFRNNTNKADNPRTKGWQNSIRHNLSMNDAFRRGSRFSPNTAPANSWYLADEAIDFGVEPTTRFRNPQRPMSRGRRGRDLRLTRHVSASNVAHSLRRTTRSRNLRDGIRSQSPSLADAWANVSTRHSTRHTTPIFDGDEQPIYGSSNNGMSGIGLGISSAELGGNINSMFNCNVTGFPITSHPINYAPYYNTPTATPALHSSTCNMATSAYNGLAHETAPVSAEGFYAGFHQNQWMEPSPGPSREASLTPMLDTPSLGLCQLSAMPSDIKSGNLFESEAFTPPPSASVTPEPQATDDIDKAFGEDFFKIGDDDCQHG